MIVSDAPKRYLTIACASLVSFLLALTLHLSIKIAFGFLLILALALLGSSIGLKTMFWIYLFIYPLLPTHAGFYLLPFLPVFKARRLLTILMLASLIRHKNLIKSIGSFFEKSPFRSEIAVWFGVLMIASIAAYTHLVPSSYYLLGVFFENILFAILAFTLVKNRNDYEIILRLISWSGFIVAVMAIIEHISNHNFFAYFPVFTEGMKYSVSDQIREGAVRVRGSFDHAISLGCYLVLALPAVLLYARKSLVKIFTLLPAILLAIVLTQSRLAIVSGLLFTVMFVMLLGLRHKRAFVFLVLSAMFAVVLLLINFDWFRIVSGKAIIYLNPFSEKSLEAFSSTKARLNQFHYILALVKQNHFLGFGHSLVARYDLGLRTIDCFYLSTLFYFGVAGLIALSWMLISVFVKTVKSLCYLRTAEIVPFLIISLVFCLMLLGVSLETFHFLFWVYMGILSRLLRGLEPMPEK